MHYYIFQSLNNLTLKIQPINIQNQTTITLVPESFCIQLPGKTLLDKKPNLYSVGMTTPQALIPEIDEDYEADDDFPYEPIPRPLVHEIVVDYETDDDLPGDPIITHYRLDGTYFDDLSVREILKIPTESTYNEISPTASFTELDQACPSGTFMIGLATNPSKGLELLFVATSREDVKELLALNRPQPGDELEKYEDWTWRYTSNPAELIETLMERLNSKYELDKILFLDKTGKPLNNCISESLIAIIENKNVSAGKLIEVKIARHPDDESIEEKKAPVASKTTSELDILKIFSACTLGKPDMFNRVLAAIAEENRKDVLQMVRAKIDQGKFLLQKQKALKYFEAFCATLTPAEPSTASLRIK
jgi:hypothetical protein